MFLDAVEARQRELLQPPVGDVANVRFDVGRREAVDRPELEREIDEAVLEPHDGPRAIDDVVAHGIRQRAGLARERVEQPDDALAVQRFVAHGPRHDLAHAAHLVVPREVQQDREAREEL